LALFIFLWRLGVATVHVDELAYAAAGSAYVRDGNFSFNLEHPLLAKYLIGAVQTGFGATGPRYLAASVGLTTGLVLFLFARRVAGFWAGLIVFGLWILLPDPVVLDGTTLAAPKIERFALLDVFMGLFFSLALLCGWRWATGGGWRWALSAGIAAGLAASSKAPGILVLFPLLLGGLYARQLSKTAVWEGVAAVLICVATALATYLPVAGRAPSIIAEMFQFHAERGAGGHPVLLGGALYSHPPWWATAWFYQASIGISAAVAVLGLVVASLLVLERRLAVYLLVALLVPLGYIAFVSPLVLPHYYYILLPPLTLLAGLALYRLARNRTWMRVVAAAAAVPLVVAGARTVEDVATLRPRDYSATANLLQDSGLSGGSFAATGYGAPLLNAYLPRAKVSDQPSGNPDGVIIDSLIEQRLGDPGRLSAFLAANRKDYSHRKVDRLDVYLRANR
jgi:4-amino-4-deoxy-L-arabinose transferase-like glycosyltransferase